MREDNELIRFVEPVLRFCLARVSSRSDAEDLAGEIMLHALEGLRKYEVGSLDAWVWRIARNRYARFSDKRRREKEMFAPGLDPVLLSDSEDAAEPVCETEDEGAEEVFRALHTLSSGYRDITVDYYLGGMSVKQLAERYSLTETTVKWRLNVARERIRERMDGQDMDKIYKRINWETTTCSGSFDVNAYLSTQTARAICAACYEEPLSIEEISMKTGLPTIYIEDELPRLIYGDAISKIGNRYATDFIVLRLRDRDVIARSIMPLVAETADRFARTLEMSRGLIERTRYVSSGGDAGKIGYIAVQAALREKLRRARGDMRGGAVPVRKDGGYGWYIVQESEDSGDGADRHFYYCNRSGLDGGNIYYLGIAEYFDSDVYNGTRRLARKNIPRGAADEATAAKTLGDDDAAELVRVGLLRKGREKMFDFPRFTAEEFGQLVREFDSDDSLDMVFADMLTRIRDSFSGFVPKRLSGQTDQWVGCEANTLVGYVVEELISKGVLPRPQSPSAYGVLYVEGKYIAI